MKNYNLVVAINVLFLLTLALFLLLYPNDFSLGIDRFHRFGGFTLESVGLPQNSGVYVAALALLLHFTSGTPTLRSRRVILSALAGFGVATLPPAQVLQGYLLQNAAGFTLLLCCFLLAIVNGLAWIRYVLLAEKKGLEPISKGSSLLQVLSYQAVRAALAAIFALVIASWIAAESIRDLLLDLSSSISLLEGLGGLGAVTFTLLLAVAASLAFAWPETRDLLSLERSMRALPSRLSGTAEEATEPVPLAQSPLLFRLNQQLRALAGGSALQETRERWVRQLGEAAASEERNRLARELHDSIKQQLFSIKMSAAATAARWNIDPPGAQSSLEDVRRCAHEAMVEMQALLLQLRPEALANVGLVEALKEQGEALQYRSGATVHCYIGELPPEPQLPPAIQQALFRIAQEAMSNVSRHARAKTVSVHLGREGSELILRVQDDGQGFEPEARASGLGLQGITERLERFQGHLEIDSSSGAGTRLTVRIPLKAATPPPIPETVPSLATTVQAFSSTTILGLLLAFTPGIMPAAFFSTEAETRLSSWLFPSLVVLAIVNYLWSSRRKRSAKSPPPNSYLLSLRTFLLFAAAYCWAPHFWWAYARTNLLISIPLLALSISAGFLASLALWRFSSRKSINLHAFGSCTAIFWFAWVLLSSAGPALTYSWGFWSLSFLSGYLAIAIYLAGIILIWHEQRAARSVSL